MELRLALERELVVLDFVEIYDHILHLQDIVGSAAQSSLDLIALELAEEQSYTVALDGKIYRLFKHL